MSQRFCRLHIGAPKTGSTAIQAFCSDNRLALETHGVLYPDVCLCGFGHHDLAFLLSGGYPRWAKSQPRPLEDLLDELAGQAAAHAGDLLLSSENFYLLADPRQVRAGLARAGLFDGREPRILVYLRRQDAAHASWYNQTIKAQGQVHSFEQCLEAHAGLFDYEARLRAWAEAFGTASLEVRVYDSQVLPGGDVRRDFLATLSLPEAAFELPNLRPNTEINPDLLEFQRQLNRLPLSPVEKRRFHGRLIELSARAAGSSLFSEGDPFDLTARRAILARHEAGNAAVARTYLDRERLFPPLDEADLPTAARGQLTMDKLTAIVGWLLVHESGS